MEWFDTVIDARLAILKPLRLKESGLDGWSRTDARHVTHDDEARRMDRKRSKTSDQSQRSTRKITDPKSGQAQDLCGVLGGG